MQESGEIERLTLKDGFAFILFKTEVGQTHISGCRSIVQACVTAACKLDGTSLNGLNLRVAPRKEKAPQVAPQLKQKIC